MAISKKMVEEEERLGKAARIVKMILADNADPYSTFFGVLTGARVKALEAILDAAGFRSGK